MPLATCNCQCNFRNDGHCELAAMLEEGLPVNCPYRQQQAAASTLPGTITPGWEGLPRSFATARHYRYPGYPITPAARQR